MDDSNIIVSVAFAIIVLAFAAVGVVYFEKFMLGTKRKKRWASFQPRPLPRAARINPVVRRGR